MNLQGLEVSLGAAREPTSHRPVSHPARSIACKISLFLSPSLRNFGVQAFRVPRNW